MAIFIRWTWISLYKNVSIQDFIVAKDLGPMNHMMEHAAHRGMAGVTLGN